MPDLYMDVDTALSEVPVNLLPLVSVSDFTTIMTGIVYNATGMSLYWNFSTPGGAFTQTAVTPTSGGDYDWASQGGAIYTIEIPASGGASINNDTEGFGWFTGSTTTCLPWRGPIVCFRAAALNNALIEGGDYLAVSLIATSVSSIQSGLATSAGVASAVSPLATTSGLASAVSPLATSSGLVSSLSTIATSAGVASAVSPLATSSGVASAVSPLATSTGVVSALTVVSTPTQVASAVSPLATTSGLASAVSPLATSSGVVSALTVVSTPSDVASATSGLATSANVASAVSPLATTSGIASAVSVLAVPGDSMALTSTERTAISTAIGGATNGVATRDQIQLASLAILEAKTSGATSAASTIVVRNAGDTADLATVVVDEYGNRTTSTVTWANV